MTTWIKRILLALLIIFLAIFALCAYRMHSVTRAVPVLNYHQINDRDENSLTVHTDEFDEQMKYLSDNGYHAITPEEMMEAWENDTPLPNTAYGRSKLQAERYLADVPGLNYVVLRPTGVYGPRERDYFMMAKSIRQHVDFAVGFRPQVLTFIYVADLVEAAYLALDRGPRGAVYPLSDGRQYTSRTFSDLLQLELGVKRVVHLTAPLWVLWLVSCIAGKAAALLGRTSTLNLDKYRIMRQRNWKCSIEAARRDLGYRPQWPLTRGVRAAVEWYKAEGWL